jgi:undecaprenyl-diphosphatase
MRMLSQLDSSLFYMINKGMSNHVLDVAMPVVTQCGRWELFLALALVLLLVKKKEVRDFGMLLLAAVVVGFLLVTGLKLFIARPRPFDTLSDVSVLVTSWSYSFPSGHAACIFTVVSLVSTHTKKYYYLYALACAVAFSRIYVGVHFPSDVLAGAFIGFLVGKGVVAVANRMKR